jgi:hypothetical protein
MTDMDDQRFKEELDRWITKEQPIEEDDDKSFENGFSFAIDNVIAYLERKKLNYSAQKKFINGIIRYIEKMKARG